MGSLQARTLVLVCPVLEFRNLILERFGFIWGEERPPVVLPRLRRIQFRFYLFARVLSWDETQKKKGGRTAMTYPLVPVLRIRDVGMLLILRHLVLAVVEVISK